MTYDSSAWDKETEDAGPSGVRLQKALAAAGVASRRASEDLIAQRRVKVNGKTVEEMGRRINLATDKITVDGKAVQLDVSKKYYMLNKPRGVVSTMSDEVGRPDLREFTDQFDVRLFNVGRLDYDTSGLLVLTNDGDVTHVMSHPSFGVSKTYIAKVEGMVSAQTIARLRNGIELDDGPIKADKARLIDEGKGKGVSLVEITLHSGRNRIVRRMLEEVGHPVIDLVRRQFGPLNLGTLRSGAVRELTKVEQGELLTIVRDAEKTSEKK
ncbi:23S rRNA pseudouridine2605 synthase/16S rRNA pseudouridine516 synthase [Lysinibacter cavernae]|uniref:Pseudouridine synthase n=1 Tax=Lysinibacter cavernae TaxID=1640652 RepID=A0A7X5TSC1_9MICO|nr:23S rRNA pseudouridine2605 synthase/16S rRNA pseudouridine516 synthase [Lysinibacter cavernae]